MVERLFVHTEAMSSDLVSSFRAAFPKAIVVEVQAESEVRKHLGGPNKRAVYIGPRRSRFVSRFHPPNGMVCAGFWKFTPETECLYSCHYCYLVLTMRVIPYLRVASNVEKGLDELERVLWAEAAQGRRAMFNIGELADGRLLDPITGLSLHLLPVLDRYENGMLHVLTKSGPSTISNYLANAHLARGRVIHVASINPQTIVDLIEDDTPPVTDRLMALGELQRAGYRIRLRIDPIFDLRDFDRSEVEAFQVYTELVEQIGEYCRPEMVTLGSYRPNSQLLPHIRCRYPDSLVLRVATHREGAKRRIANREVFYRHIVEAIRQWLPGVHVALCKETMAAWEQSGLPVRPLQCSCLPFVDERRVEGLYPLPALATSWGIPVPEEALAIRQA
jgi:DNA repair photolyase